MWNIYFCFSLHTSSIIYIVDFTPYSAVMKINVVAVLKISMDSYSDNILLTLLDLLR